MKIKILFAILYFVIFILITSILQWIDVIHLPCVKNTCLLGGVCTTFNKNNLCLNAKDVNELCSKYCGKKKCEIGISEPIVINCK